MEPDVRFLGAGPHDLSSGLTSVVDGVLAGGVPAPPWIAIDDGTERWAVDAATLSAVERACGVVAVSSDEALVTAHRLGVGGAMWLPPSSAGATEAFVAAATSAAPCDGHDPGRFELLDDGAPAVVVRVMDRCFWRAQLGERRLTAWLAELSNALGVPAAILPWPALVAKGKEPDEVAEAWRALLADSGRIVPDVAVVPLPENTPDEGLLATVYRELLEARPTTTPLHVGGRSLPVHELPHGRRVGWWGRRLAEPLPAGGWHASPEDDSRPTRRWNLQRRSGSETIEEVLTSGDVTRVNECAAVRFPGWASRDIRSGSPAGLLVARLAEAAARVGLPLWIPNLDGDALRFTLGLPGTLWVDGPAVPRS